MSLETLPKIVDPSVVGVPVPVVNGRWIKGVGGAAVWSPLQTTDGILPAGGSSGQILAKQSVTDYDAAWQTPAGLTNWFAVSAWPGFASGNWTNFNAPYGPLEFQMGADGRVYFRGLVNWGQGTSIVGQSVFTMQTPYVTDRMHLFDLRWGSSAGTHGTVRVDFSTGLSGLVAIGSEIDGTLPGNWANTWVSFAGVNYSTLRP